MKDRIKQIRKSIGLKQTEFAEKLGIKGNTITSYETGTRVPSDAIIKAICREFNVSEVWLRTGEGEPFNQLDEDAEFIAICEAISLSDDDIIKKIIKSYWVLDEKEKAAIRKLIDGLCK